MEIQKPIRQKNSIDSIKSVLRNTAFSVIMTGVAASAAYPDTLLYVPPNPDSQKSIQHTETGKQAAGTHRHPKVSIGSSESFKLSPDRKKISYTFRLENKDMAHVLVAKSRNPKTGEQYDFEMYADFALGVANLRIFNASAGDDMASVMLFFNAMAKTGEKITFEISYSKNEITKKNSVTMNILNASNAKRIYTTGPIDIEAGERIESYQAERLEFAKKKKHKAPKPSEHQNQHIDPLKEALLD